MTGNATLCAHHKGKNLEGKVASLVESGGIRALAASSNSTLKFSTLKFSTLKFSTLKFSTLKFSTLKFSTLKLSALNRYRGIDQNRKSRFLYQRKDMPL
jgi:hypothetical protein